MTSDLELWHWLLLAAVGVVGGFLNVMAGGGALLVMPVLVLMGLPGPAANGTTRVAILAQNISATTGFRRHGFSDIRLSLTFAACAVPGRRSGRTSARSWTASGSTVSWRPS